MNNLTNAQLDQMAAEKMGWEKYQTRSEWCKPNQGSWIMDFDEWHPTEDAEQIQEYLWPKLREDEWVVIETGFIGPWFCVEISRHHLDITRSAKGDVSDMLSTHETKDPDQINRTKVIAWLEAMEKIDE